MNISKLYNIISYFVLAPNHLLLRYNTVLSTESIKTIKQIMGASQTVALIISIYRMKLTVFCIGYGSQDVVPASGCRALKQRD